MIKLFKKICIENKKGQAIVEMALILPLLLLLILGMIDFGRVMNAYLIANHASREGARQAAVGKSDSEIVGIINLTTTSLDSSTININISPQASDRTRGTEAQVTVSCQVEIITPLVSSVIPNPFVIQTSTSMRVE